MFLETNLTTRRQFLQRSMLGFGSALVLPSLLASCTDHISPNPPLRSPAVPPYVPSAEYSIDPNDAAKTAVTTALNFVPEVGGILSGLVSIFWPDSTSQQDVWDQIKDKVQALINLQISNDDYNRVTSQLSGLGQAIADYVAATSSTDPNVISQQWIATRTTVDAAIGAFKQQGDELLLLPLFVQYANMNLALYRDGAAYGGSWGWDNTFHNSVYNQLSQNINTFTKYANDTYNAGFLNLSSTAPKVPQNCEPFRTLNNFNRQMILTVFDFVDTWQYYDITIYPNGAKDGYNAPITILTREIYADPIGTATTDIALPFPVPTQFPTQISVWGEKVFRQVVDSVQVTYPVSGGPNGVTQTARMGANSGYSTLPDGQILTIKPENPITKAGAVNTGGSFISSLQFGFADRTKTGVFGGDVMGGLGLISYTDRALSSVYLGEQKDTSNLLSTHGYIVFGFLNWQAPVAKLNAARVLYVKSPKEHSVADFIKAFPKLPIPADLITDELKQIRKQYWEWVKARAHK